MRRCRRFEIETTKAYLPVLHKRRSATRKAGLADHARPGVTKCEFAVFPKSVVSNEGGGFPGGRCDFVFSPKHFCECPGAEFRDDRAVQEHLCQKRLRKLAT